MIFFILSPTFQVIPGLVEDYGIGLDLDYAIKNGIISEEPDRPRHDVYADVIGVGQEQSGTENRTLRYSRCYLVNGRCLSFNHYLLSTGIYFSWKHAGHWPDCFLQVKVGRDCATYNVLREFPKYTGKWDGPIVDCCTAVTFLDDRVVLWHVSKYQEPPPPETSAWTTWHPVPLSLSPCIRLLTLIHKNNRLDSKELFKFDRSWTNRLLSQNVLMQSLSLMRLHIYIKKNNIMNRLLIIKTQK